MLIGIVVIGIVQCCYSYLCQIQERSQTHFSSYERQSKDPPGESWGLDRVCTQTVTTIVTTKYHAMVKTAVLFYS